MILITLGSQKFHFNRLLKEIDNLIIKGIINERVFAQIGYSDYIPQNYEYEQFLDREKFSDLMNKSDIVITHGGTGAIISAIKRGKKVIALPRLAKYGEHVDNHQTEIVNQFKKMELIIGIMEVDELEEALQRIKTTTLKRYKSNTENILKSIQSYIDTI